MQRIQQVIDMLVEHKEELCQAMGEDFGGRPAVFSLANDILGSLSSLKHARDHLRDWLGDSERPSVKPFDMFGATAWVKYQPKGVIGIIGTWNAPLFTLLSPLACAFAAGNRAVLKPSEIAPRTAQVLAEAVAKRFDPQVLAVVQGGPEVAAAFAEQPWNHMVFTGSTSVGKLIMAAAARNLVPVTLELGGKSPVLVGDSADIANAAERIAVGKSLNSGQLCVSPDVVWVHESRLQALADGIASQYQALYPSVTGNADMTPVINERHHARVKAYVDDAKARGLTVLEVGAAQAGADRRLPLALVVNPPAEAEISQHEIFGPAVVLRSFLNIRDAVAAINAGERPLACTTSAATRRSRTGCWTTRCPAVSPSMMWSCIRRWRMRRLAAWALRAWATIMAARVFSSSAMPAPSTRPATTTRVASGACCRPITSSSHRCCRPQSPLSRCASLRKTTASLRGSGGPCSLCLI
jgi:coniferyl-aldehyde dehydrogenase